MSTANDLVISELRKQACRVGLRLRGNLKDGMTMIAVDDPRKKPLRVRDLAHARYLISACKTVRDEIVASGIAKFHELHAQLAKEAAETKSPAAGDQS